MLKILTRPKVLVFLSRFVYIPSLVVNRVVRGISDKESKAQKGGPGSGITTRGIGISSVFHGIRDQANNKSGFTDQNSHRF